MFYFGMVFVVEGIGQTDGIIAQPLIYYFKEVHSWTPVQVTAALTAFNFPWIIKPIYGLVSDFVPLFGYRRKSYLILASLVSDRRLSSRRAHGGAEPAIVRAAADRLRDGDREHAVRRALGRERPALRHQRGVREPAVALVPHRGDELVADRRPAGTEICHRPAPCMARR